MEIAPSSLQPTRPIQSGRRSGSASSSSEHGSIHQNGSGSLMPTDQTRPRSSSSSKALLTRALLEAQNAVQLDNDNEIPGALEAYGRAVALLSRVMEVSSSPEEHERLRTIHNSYLYRIHLLSAPQPQPAPPTPPTPPVQGATATAAAPPPPPPHSSSSSQSRSPPPRHFTPSRSSGQASSLAVTPASSSTATHSEDSETTSRSAAAPPLRRIKKTGPGILPPSEPRGLRQRADSTSASELGSAGHIRHHTRAHTGGSHRMAGDLIQADQYGRVSKMRPRDHIALPMHSAPTAPLPPTPMGLGPPPAAPPPVPIPIQNQGSAASGHSTPNASGSYSFLTSVASSPPPKAPLPPAPGTFASPPGSPANVSRRVSPLVPTTSQQPAQQSTPQPGQTSSSPSPPSSQSAQQQRTPAPEDTAGDEKSNATTISNFYDDDLIAEEYDPNQSSNGQANVDQSIEDPHSRERSMSKGSFNGGSLEQQKSKDEASVIQDEQKAEEPNRLSQQQQEQQQTLPLEQQQETQQEAQQELQPPSKPSQHQRSYSQSSTLSTQQTNASQSSLSKSPLSPPMYNFQQGSSSFSSLSALDSTPSKRTSDSSRSLKDSSPLGRTSGGSGTTNGSGAAGSATPLSSSPAQGPPPQRPAVLQHQYSSSKLSSTLSSSNASSPTLDKAWSPNLNGHNQTQSAAGGATLYDVISDDPFAGMSFPLPPPFLEPPPSDPYLRCFWLMRRLEQTMTTGGFLTRRMYVPRAIWYQSLIRLPAADTKMNACQTLSSLCNKLLKQMQNGSLNLMVEGGPEADAERLTVLKELEGLETAAHQVQSKLSKKLSFIHRPGKNGLNLTISTTTQNYNEENQGPVTGGNASVYGAASLYGNASHDWLGNDEPPVPAVPEKASSKKGGVSVGGSAPDTGTGSLKSQWKSFSKSVQKSIGNDKVEDTSMYTDAVMKLFQSSYILESMLRHYSAQTHYHLQIVSRLRRLCDVFNQVICAFVVRDLGELMGKYVKRVSAWVVE